MLVLTRSEGQRVTLALPNGDKITVVMNGIKGNQASLAFDAPQNVHILRDDAKNTARKPR